MSKADLTKLQPILEAIPFDQLSEPSNIPVPIYLREAEQMAAAGRRDLAELKAIGFRVELLAELKVRIGALRQAQSNLKVLPFSGRRARLEWAECSPEGFKMLKELKRAMSFAYRKHSELLKSVREAVRGRSAAAMIQGLNNLALLGRRYGEPLEAMKFDMARLAEASALADRLGRVLGAADGEQSNAHMRNRAFTHLKEGLGELREYALYALGDDKERMADYTSAYLRNKRVRRREKAAAAALEREQKSVFPVPEHKKVVPEADFVGTDRVKPGMRAGEMGRALPVECREAQSECRESPEVRREQARACTDRAEVCTDYLGRRLERSGEGAEGVERVVFAHRKRSGGLESGTGSAGKPFISSRKHSGGHCNGINGAGRAVFSSESKINVARKQSICPEEPVRSALERLLELEEGEE